MSAVLKASAALGLWFVASAWSLPAFAASSRRVASPPERHPAADSAHASALATPFVGPSSAPPRAPETDGLSRNDEDCNMGCIDH